MLESSKVVLINMAAIFFMSAKLATLGLSKISVFRNKGYGVIIPVYDVTNKILLPDSVYIADYVW